MARGSAGSGSGGGAVSSVAGKTGAVSLVKGDVGLGNVDNTADTAKPVSTAAQAALDAKAPLASPTFTGTVSGVSKAAVGLGNVDNTSDVNKPVSSAQATINATLAPLASPTFTGTVSGVSKAAVGLGNVDNTADTNKPVSTAQATAIAAVAYGPAMLPPVGYAVSTPGISGYSTTQPAYQRQTFVPVYVGAGGFTADAIGFNIGTAYSGATIPTVLVGLYANDPSTGYPKTDSLLAQSTTPLAASTTGNNWVTFTSTITLAQGWYWMSWLIAGPAVATAGTTVNQAATAIAFPTSGTTSIGTNVRSLGITGQTALQTTARTPNSFNTGGNADQPVLALRRSA
jgi:hypothetical protein